MVRYRGAHWFHELGPVQVMEEELGVVKIEGLPFSPYTIDAMLEYRKKAEKESDIPGKILKRTEGKKCKPIRHHRLISFFVGYGGSPMLSLDETDYMLFLVVNKEAEKDPEYAKLLRERGRDYFNDEWAFYSHILGTNALIRTADGKFPVGRRAMDLSDYPGGFDTPGGHSEVEKHGFTGKGQFDAIKMEMGEETGVRDEDIGSIHLVGITRDTRNRKPSLNYFAQLKIDEAELRRRPRDREYDRFDYVTEEQIAEAVEKDRLVPGSQGAAVAWFHLQGKQIHGIGKED